MYWRFEILMAVKSFLVCWLVTPNSHVDGKNVSKEYITSVFRRPAEDGGYEVVRNFGNQVQYCKAPQQKGHSQQ